jgi:glycosyltransferase involved in cell wall biosynthesis
MSVQVSHPIISVVVPCYNYGHFLEECLNSVLAQTFKNWECIVIDNASTDNTAQISKQFSQNDSRFHSLHYTSPGVALARNFGAEASKGKYLLFLDADDKIAATYLEKALAAFENKPGIKLVYCEAQLFGASSGKWKLPAYSYRNLLIENVIFCTALIHKEDFLKAGGFSADLKEGFEDWDLWIRFLQDGAGVLKLTDVLFFYRIRSNSRNHSLDREKQVQLRKTIFNRHKEIYETYFSLPELLYENLVLRQKAESMNNSYELKLGNIILKPLRFLKNLFSKGS